MKAKLIQILTDHGINPDNLRIRHYKCSPWQKRYKPQYREEECWIYPKQPKKVQKTKYKNGQLIKYFRNDKPIMESQPGTLITQSDLDNADFMEMIISDLKR